MEFYSTRNKSYRLSGEQAVIAGIAPDGGLFFLRRRKLPVDKLRILYIINIHNIQG